MHEVRGTEFAKRLEAVRSYLYDRVRIILVEPANISVPVHDWEPHAAEQLTLE